MVAPEVVVDTVTLRNFLLAGALDVLLAFFGGVIAVPSEVFDKAEDPDSIQAGRGRQSPRSPRGWASGPVAR